MSPYFVSYHANDSSVIISLSSLMKNKSKKSRDKSKWYINVQSSFVADSGVAHPPSHIDNDFIWFLLLPNLFSMTEFSPGNPMLPFSSPDWNVLRMILERVPQVLQNKALILSRDANDIDYFASTLCALVGFISWKESVLYYNSLYRCVHSHHHSFFFIYISVFKALITSSGLGKILGASRVPAQHAHQVHSLRFPELRLPGAGISSFLSHAHGPIFPTEGEEADFVPWYVEFFLLRSLPWKRFWV